ncbi:hypothetical protein [Xenorhabdus lircayensis]|uniref:Uncharacterized protein n=1 Tax=Xenorhabdus lircayensis TaxID=2763499 RepID=A0ABS0U4Z8_9GAMM|nr:hypothetical protein [Xenorhabdus lircayensis]MBI6548939.1 hypothetical protein [Xenorhabdus lircayensis]
MPETITQNTGALYTTNSHHTPTFVTAFASLSANSYWQTFGGLIPLLTTFFLS